MNSKYFFYKDSDSEFKVEKTSPNKGKVIFNYSKRDIRYINMTLKEVYSLEKNVRMGFEKARCWEPLLKPTEFGVDLSKGLTIYYLEEDF